MTSKTTPNRSVASPWRHLSVGVILFLLLLTAIVWVRMGRQAVQMNELNQQYEHAKTAHAHAVATQKISLMAASVENELAGWKKQNRSCSFFLKTLTDIPQEDLFIQNLSFVRYFHLENLPESQKNPLMNTVLSLAGEVVLEACEAQKGRGEYAFPWFLEEIRSGIKIPVAYEKVGLLDEDFVPTKVRTLEIKFPVDYLWEPILLPARY